MPRQPRLDIPGLLQHVIVRGIERRKIFRNNSDRKDIVERFSALLIETGTDCFAWALIPNHFHLLLRPNRIPLHQFMRRLLTGYAICFNKRHQRSGHLFQNRYKSIVCEEDSYLLELIRYIHLNPLRAGLVKDIEGLGTYAWCGHGALLGHKPLAGQNIAEVLSLYGSQPSAAREGYVRYVARGITDGNRPELVGGGLLRSCANQPPQEMQEFDARVLGSGAFVEELRRHEELQDKLRGGMSLDELLQRISRYFELEPKQVQQRSRDPQRCAARDLYCALAVRTLGRNGVDTGHMLGLQRSAVSHAVKRGEVLLGQDSGMEKRILDLD